VTLSQAVLPLKREERRSWPQQRKSNESSIEILQNGVLLHAKLLRAVRGMLFLQVPLALGLRTALSWSSFAI
jgi:hypothetical protein